MDAKEAEKGISLMTLMLLIAFAPVNAFLFTPALPQITNYFSISSGLAQHTISWFLIGYAMGQLIYGPLANRFGRKPALYAGIFLEIISSFLCIFSSKIHAFQLLVIARFFLALGSGVGFKMAFTIVNDKFDSIEAARKISYLTIALVLFPGFGVMLGGILTENFGWISTFYAGLLYGLILLDLVSRLPETKKNLDLKALRMSELIRGYTVQFKNTRLLLGSLLMGAAGPGFVYVFSAFAPFVAINILGISPQRYGIYSLLPPLGMVMGSILSSKLSEKHKQKRIVKYGIKAATIGSFSMLVLTQFTRSAFVILFLPFIVCYLGTSIIFSNTSALIMENVNDKSNASAVMSFITLGSVTFLVLSLGIFNPRVLLIPIVFVFLCGTMFILNKLFAREGSQ